MPLRRKIMNIRYSFAEVLVRDATSNDSSMPSQDILIQIADLTKAPATFADTVGVIWRRLNDKCKNWRHIYKALIVIESCLRFGSVSFIKECRAKLPYVVTLCDFVYTYDQGSNAGHLVRSKAQRVVSLLKDEALLKQERHVARANHLKDGDDENRYFRNQSVSNPSNNQAEENQMNLAISLQDSKSKPDLIGKPTLLESSRKIGSGQSDDLLCLDSETSQPKRLNSWLDSSSKCLSSMDASDPQTPSSSLIDPAPIATTKWNLISKEIVALNNSPKSIVDSSGGSVTPQLDSYGQDLSIVLSKVVPVHKTSADDYFENRAKDEARITASGASVTANGSIVAPKQADSKLSTILGNHRGLVDLDNICSIPKPPPSNFSNGLGDRSRLSLMEPEPLLQPSVDWGVPTQPVLLSTTVSLNLQNRDLYNQAWPQWPEPSKPNNIRPVATTNPFL